MQPLHFQGAMSSLLPGLCWATAGAYEILQEHSFTVQACRAWAQGNDRPFRPFLLSKSRPAWYMTDWDSTASSHGQYHFLRAKRTVFLEQSDESNAKHHLCRSGHAQLLLAYIERKEMVPWFIRLFSFFFFSPSSDMLKAVTSFRPSKNSSITWKWWDSGISTNCINICLAD